MGLSPPAHAGERCAWALEAALDWSVEHLDMFRPEAPDGAVVPSRMKGVIELGIMTCAYADLLGARADPRVGRVVDFLTSVQADVRVSDYLFRSPRHFIVYATLHAVLRKLGHEDPARRRELERAVAANLHRHIERPPHRLMDVRLILDWCGIDDPALPSLGALSGGSIEFAPLSPLHVDDISAYDLTHAIMFRCGFGTLPDVLGGAPRAGERRQLLETLLICHTQRQHWDLVGELLFCLQLLGWGESASGALALAAFLDAQAGDGSIVGDEHDGPPEGESRDEWFERRYHTTLVAVMLLAHRLGPSARRRSDDVRGGPRGDRQSTPQPRLEATTAPPPHVYERAFTWLAGELHSSASAAVPADLGRATAMALLGMWICRRRADLGETADHCLREASEGYVRCLDAGGGRTASAVDVLAAAVAERHGQPGAGEWVRDLAGTLVASGPAESSAHREVAVALHGLGHALPRPRFPDDGSAILRPPVERQVLENMLFDVEWHSSVGATAIAPELAAAIGPVLPGVAAYHLRAYELLLSCRIYRCLAYAGGAPSTLRHASRFLLLHQREDGGFGHLGPEVNGVPSSDARSIAAVVRAVSLPYTVACLWTLAELSASGWRLHASLRRTHANGHA